MFGSYIAVHTDAWVNRIPHFFIKNGSKQKIPATVVELISSIKENHSPIDCQILVNMILVKLLEDGIVK